MVPVRTSKRRRGAAVAMSALLFLACGSLMLFHGEFQNFEPAAASSPTNPKNRKQTRTSRAMQQKQCVGKERVLDILQGAVDSPVGRKCKISSLLASRKLKKGTRHVYGKTTCDVYDMCEQLPKYKQVAHLYGEDPIVLGMETCGAPNSLVPRVAGLYNSGTNLLADSLGDLFPSLLEPDNDTDVPWGKHRPPNKYRKLESDAGDVLPIVVVRDPFRWMASMCKTNYDASWMRVPHRHCPNLVPIEKDWDTKLRKKQTYLSTYKVTVDSNAGQQNEEYQSLADMWTAYYSEYLDADYPRLIVRYEDLLFHRPAVMRQISKCVTDQDATLKQPIQYRLFSSKLHGRSSDLISAVVNYGTSRGRYAGMATEDLRYAKTALDPEVLGLCGYLAVPNV